MNFDATKLKLVWPGYHKDLDIVSSPTCVDGLMIIHLKESPYYEMKEDTLDMTKEESLQVERDFLFKRIEELEDKLKWQIAHGLKCNTYSAEQEQIKIKQIKELEDKLEYWKAYYEEMLESEREATAQVMRNEEAAQRLIAQMRGNITDHVRHTGDDIYLTKYCYELEPKFENVEIVAWECTSCHSVVTSSKGYKDEPKICQYSDEDYHCNNKSFIRLSGVDQQPVKQKVKRRETLAHVRWAKLSPPDDAIVMWEEK